MKSSKQILAATFVAALCLLVASDTPENRTEFRYDQGQENGPENWAKICDGWETCGSGMSQSPINIMEEEVDIPEDLEGLNRSYYPSNAVVVNRGHDIMVKWADGAGAIYVDGTEYFLKQLHWHLPSEHTINDKRFVLEGHMVHESADKRLAVVGFMYKSGTPDPFISKLMHPIREIEDRRGAETDIGVVDPRGVRSWRHRYYRYKGSLTAPPCTEGVTWTIMRKVGYVSQEQVELLKNAVEEEHEKNARPLQPINGRPIKMYVPPERQRI